MKDKFLKVLNEALEVPETKPVAPSISEEDRRTNAVSKVIDKVGRCIDFQSLFALEEDFNKAGLTIQTTPNNRMILCKLREGRAVTEHAIDDYIFIGSAENAISELTDRAVSKIGDFIRTNAGEADKLQNVARVWRNGLKMYESTISIMNEDTLADDGVISESVPLFLENANWWRTPDPSLTIDDIAKILDDENEG